MGGTKIIIKSAKYSKNEFIGKTIPFFSFEALFLDGMPGNKLILTCATIGPPAGPSMAKKDSFFDGLQLTHPILIPFIHLVDSAPPPPIIK
jgi:hypothetical protein